MKKAMAVLCAMLMLLVCFGCAGGPSAPSQGGEQTQYQLRVDSAKREYKLGEAFSDQIMVSLLGLEDGTVVSQRILSADEYEIDSSAFDSSMEGDYTIRVTQKGTQVFTTFTVSVRAVAVERLELQGQRLRFALGEAFTTDSTVSPTAGKACAADIYQPVKAIYTKQTASTHKSIVNVIRQLLMKYAPLITVRRTGVTAISERLPFCLSAIIMLCAEKDTVTHATETTPAIIQQLTKAFSAFSSYSMP